jgi:branched-chain amino acid transport system substrate-binding protein
VKTSLSDNNPYDAEKNDIAAQTNMLKKGDQTMRNIFKLTVVLVVLACVMAYPYEARTEELKIGVILPLSGLMAHEGQESLSGIELATETLNAKGGLLGKKVKLIISDAPDAKAGAGEAEKLITQENIKLILGTFSSGICYSASEVANRYKVPYFEVAAGIADTLTERGLKYFWRITPRASNYAQVVSEYTKEVTAPKLGIPPNKLRIAIAYEDGPYGTQTVKDLDRIMPTFGLTNIVAKEAYSAKGVDLSSMLLKIQAAKPDLFLSISYAPDAILIGRQAKELNFNPKAWQGFGGGWGSPSLYEALKNDLNGIFSTEFAPVHINKAVVPGAEDFHKRFKEKYNRPLESSIPQTSCMAATVVFDIIKRARSLDPEDIAKAAWKTDIPIWTTINGWGVKFNGPDQPHPGQNSRAFMYNTQWKNGEHRVVWPLKAKYADPVYPLPSWKERVK